MLMARVRPQFDIDILIAKIKCSKCWLRPAELDNFPVVANIQVIVALAYFDQPAQRHKFPVAGPIEVELRVAVEIDCNRIAPGFPAIPNRGANTSLYLPL